MHCQQPEIGIKHYRQACISFIAALRPLFLENAVRRTLKSRDFQGHPIWEMEDPVDVSMNLEPSMLERQVIDKMASNAEEARDRGTEYKNVSL